MKSMKQVIEQTAMPAKLVRAVIHQLNGKGRLDWQDIHNNLSDITNHGIDGGFNGFVYTRDTVAFFKRNRKEILELVEQQADELSESPINMVASFRCLAGIPASRKIVNGSMAELSQNWNNEFAKSVAHCLYGRITDEDIDVANALAWFAGEEVARAFCDE